MISLILLLLITAIAFAVIGMSNTENAINTNFKSEEVQYFAARAGVEEARNRILPSATDQNGNSVFLANLPTQPVDAAGTVLYILNGNKTDGTPVTLADVTTPGTAAAPNPYFDDALCHDIPATSPLAITHVPANVRCPNTLPTVMMTTTPSIAPYALDYKWVRIMIKENASGPYKVDTTKSDLFPVCWDKSLANQAEIVTPLVTNCAANQPLKLARPVYLVTALAVSPSGTTRRIVQEEVSLGITFNPSYAIFGTSTQCPAVQFVGNGKTGSFTAVAGNTSNPPNGANTTSGADVGTNGGISMSGNSTIAGNADVASNPPCFTPDKMNSPATATSIAPETFPVTKQPNPPPPTTSKTYTSNTTVTPGNLYGNVKMSGSSVLTLQVPAGQGTAANPAVFIFNSLSISGQASMAITPANGSACGGTSNCYVQVIIAGNGTSSPLTMTGNSWGNMSGIPESLVFNLAQPTACSASPCGTVAIAGNAGSYAIVNAPMDDVQISGNGDIFGSVVSYTTVDNGNGTMWHDTNAGNQYIPDPYLQLVAFRELSY